MKHLLLAPVLAAVLAACAPASAPGEGSTSMTADTASLPLTAYTWRLNGATDAKGQPILRTGVERGLRLSFTQDALSIQGGCNTQFGGYRLAAGVLSVAHLAGTMKACEPALMRLDADVAGVLKGDMRLRRSGDAAAPELTLTAPDGSVLRFAGEPTAETRYGGPGETVFLEVAAATVACNHPMMPGQRCLQVRERRYSESGVALPAQEDWHPLYQTIEGYQHHDGVRTVLRVKRYERKNPPADASATVYVLDMVVEQQLS
ncbi:PF14302 domain protein [Bordetella holmesii CDC-H635-BH]|uniref:PF14302 domain protein n=3 Tax=Bordetella holmesii TaxID=35814 RepID=A0A158M4K5_9BORD|nr:META domain protein [Bordetella holmesii 1058]KAK83671.1 PF14302 domain protein [Bordetella holmesii CDC-H809-BH]KAK91010.1 PF14302 domain protein [Bordetella holmesii CDC-H585-BH]KAL00193.1 PF14302 domain protein [Bordetella holmesii CDC-H635-BH]KCV02215.1 PF14302 domain protein [Bordetella holmesii CDC-H629-BH]KCV10106.1 PF14302 domain protein [Bordetella holmesii CDC-H785-BH]KCV13618.1 PF14302 domain protein [Bordetella holmesii CDC-H643-BH]SUV89908.1 lipoprotein [Bordetella holmesii]